ncbi:colipase precursor [Ictidomys tridecemlineatus]|uniref:Colipase n=2 Tax=Marmotini TaxID=337730 RepID=COL_ICTTR|nr:colipase precursor [Ictidomys tridecemlineatus]XP_026239512.1 colipase [Urocitellus parryii]Q91XL7.1 RecName: Full=Colipase; Flags: Precursor [Ictidomys tridecemlineatus]AAK72258.1 pancreatic colipase [Ictidomys tridecemlineatus]KAG3289310.1 colipase [Ictidomys tridecemlineatus]
MKVLVLLLVTLAVVYAAPDPRGILINLEDGEICMNSAQCKSSCCQHFSPLGVARCTRKASENSECSPKTLYGIYYKCPCERGLTCESDRTIIGAITNTNYGICLDAGRSKE